MSASGKISHTKKGERNMNTTASLNTKAWNDADIRKIDSEQMARFAYEVSNSLKVQYPSVELFLAHWSGQRKLYRLDTGLDAGPSEERLRQEWNSTPTLREEFGSFEKFSAFLKADRAGQVGILRKG